MATETIFHKIIKREIPADIVYEDEKAIAFRDIQPAAPVHVLVVPKEDLVSLAEANTRHTEILGHLMYVASEVARKLGIARDGYRVVTNSGPNAQQSVFQIHLHVLGGRAFTWPPG